MKKSTILLAAMVALSSAFVACDEDSLTELIEQATGNAKFEVVSVEANVLGNADNKHVAGDVINFKSALADVANDTIEVEGEQVIVKGFMSLGSGSSVSTSSAELAFPLYALKLNGEEAGSYTIQSPFDGQEFLDDVDNGWQNLVTNNDRNSLVMTEVDGTDTIIYLAISGTASFEEMPEYAGTVSATLSNVTFCVVRFGNLNFVRDLAQQYAADPNNEDVQQYIEMLSNKNYEPFFPKMTVNGTLSCTRVNLAAFVKKLL